MNLRIETIKSDQIDIIKNLWEQLNTLQLQKSKFFKEHFKTYTFEEKCRNFPEKTSNEIQIDVIYDNKKAVGYCISIISNKTGEIDSLFIAEEYRKYGYGKIIVEKSIRWFEMNNCEIIHVSVSEGNESVFDFYENFGFYPRFTYLTLRKPYSESNRQKS